MRFIDKLVIAFGIALGSINIWTGIRLLKLFKYPILVGDELVNFLTLIFGFLIFVYGIYLIVTSIDGFIECIKE